jgi:hypothetical protein
MPNYFDLWFHIQGIDDPDEAWDKMNKVFGKHNATQAHLITNMDWFTFKQIPTSLNFLINRWEIQSFLVHMH